MKTIPSVVKTLIKINIATVIGSILIFAMLRSQQTQLTESSPDLTDQAESYHTAVKAQTTAEQAQLETSYQKIAQHEQEIKKLEQELETYKTQVKDLLLDKNAQPSVSTQNKNYPYIAKKNFPAPPSDSSLLNQLIKSGQTLPSKPTFKAIETSNQTERTQKPVTPRNTQIQSSRPSATPSTSYSPSGTVQSSKPKFTNTSEIKLDSRALFSAQSPQKPLDSFISPTNIDNYKENELKNRTAYMAQQLSKKVYGNYLAKNSPSHADQLNQHIAHANDIVAGLMIADEKGQINYGTRTYRQVQTAIRALRSGRNLNEAARLANLTPSVLNQLIKWGENRPGSLSELSEISQASPDLQ